MSAAQYNHMGIQLRTDRKLAESSIVQDEPPLRSGIPSQERKTIASANLVADNNIPKC
jgi:hypothetical protein